MGWLGCDHSALFTVGAGFFHVRKVHGRLVGKLVRMNNQIKFATRQLIRLTTGVLKIWRVWSTTGMVTSASWCSVRSVSVRKSLRGNDGPLPLSYCTAFRGKEKRLPCGNLVESDASTLRPSKDLNGSASLDSRVRGSAIFRRFVRQIAYQSVESAVTIGGKRSGLSFGKGPYQWVGPVCLLLS